MNVLVQQHRYREGDDEQQDDCVQLECRQKLAEDGLVHRRPRADLSHPAGNWQKCNADDHPHHNPPGPVLDMDHNLNMVDVDNDDGADDSVGCHIVHLALRVHWSLSEVVDQEDAEARDQRVHVVEEHAQNEPLSVAHQPTEGVALAHGNNEVLLLFNCTELAVAHVLVVDRHKEVEQSRHEYVEEYVHDALDGLEAREAVHPLQRIVISRLDHGLIDDENREGRDAHAVGTTMPEQGPTKVLEAWDCVVGERRSLIAFLTFKSKADVSLLDHVDIVGAITDGQNDFVV